MGNRPRNLITLTLGILLLLVMVIGSACTPKPAPTPTPTPTPTAAYKPPSMLVFAETAETGAGFISTQAFGAVIKAKTGVDVRVQPTTQPRDRMGLIRSGEATFLEFSPLEAAFFQMGIEDANDDGWGPQTVRAVWLTGPKPFGYGVPRDSNIFTVADLKGKRITTFPGYVTGQYYINGLIAYANFKASDYTAVPVASSTAGYDALLQGKSDVTWMTITASAAIQQDASPHGVRWLPLPVSEKEAWARMQAANPIAVPMRATAGPATPVDTWGYSGNYIAYSQVSDDLVYWMVKQVVDLYNDYKDKHALLVEWTKDNIAAIDETALPFHPGAIRYYKEIGLWTAADDAIQKQRLDAETKRIADWKAAHPTWKWNSGK